MMVRMRRAVGCALTGLHRLHISRPLLAPPRQQAVRAARPLTTASNTPSTTADATEENKDSFHVDYVATLSRCQPSAAFLASLTPQQQHTVENIKKELEIYIYMARKVPAFLDDRDWKQLLEDQSVSQRVSTLEFLAIKKRREEREASGEVSSVRQQKERAYAAHLEEQRALYEAGGMGYGPDMYQLCHNLARYKKNVNNVQSSRQLAALRMGVPKVLLDMQYMFDGMRKSERHDMGKQAQWVVSEHLTSRLPLDMHLINVPRPEDNPDVEFVMNKLIGFYSTEYGSQLLLPPVHQGGINTVCDKGEEIVYITNHAREILDGPLSADAYVVCMSKGHNRESMGAARRAGKRVRPMRLPFSRYVRWVSGPQYLPLPNLLRILREVYTSGGDWHTALHNNIAKCHLEVPAEQQAEREQRARLARELKEQKERERKELIQTIAEATQ